jgi:pimeloyl-ACP methyl ester carboxylesterase
MTDAVIPFPIAIAQAALDALQTRLAATRWPERETVDDWSQGAPLATVRALVDHWRGGYDWRRCETMLNGFGSFRTELDGLGIHFLHTPSPEPNALPILLTHGWPGSIVEFHKVIAPLADPATHGGDPADAFNVVVPSLPGYGFSDKPDSTGWTVERIAAQWHMLMQRLGYRRYVAQGGDWGSAVTNAMGRQAPDGLAAIHLNMVLAGPPKGQAVFDAREQHALDLIKAHQQSGTGYSKLQQTKPQTIGYALADSPIGQAAWIYEKFQSWTDCGGVPESVLSRDEMLDNIMLYWLPDAGASSARLYWESFASGLKPQPIAIPVAATIFPGELQQPPRAWAEPLYPNLVSWREAERGGHFAAFEQPDLFVEEIRHAFRAIR